MKRKFSITLASVAIAAGIGAAVAPTASAAPTASPIEPTPVVGSLSICWAVPIGPISMNICI